MRIGSGSGASRRGRMAVVAVVVADIVLINAAVIFVTAVLIGKLALRPLGGRSSRRIMVKLW